MSIPAIDRAAGALPAAPAVAAPVAPAQRPPEALLKGTAVQAVGKSANIDPEALEKAASHMEEYVRSVGRSLQFRVDQDSGRVVVSVRDPATGELIRQIPSEAALRIAENLDPAGAGDAAVTSLIIEGLA